MSIGVKCVVIVHMNVDLMHAHKIYNNNYNSQQPPYENPRNPTVAIPLLPALRNHLDDIKSVL